MLHISNILAKYFMHRFFGFIHAAWERSHHTHDIVLMLLNRLKPYFVEVPEAEAADLKEGPLVQAVEFAKVFELLSSSEKLSVLWGNILWVD